MVYRIFEELRSMYKLFFSEVFMKHQTGESSFLRPEIKLIVDIINHQDKNRSPMSDNLDNREQFIRIFSNEAKEIKVTPFLLQKLSEIHGKKILETLKGTMESFKKLHEYITDLGHFIEHINPWTIADDIWNLSLDLC